MANVNYLIAVLASNKELRKNFRNNPEAILDSLNIDKSKWANLKKIDMERFERFSTKVYEKYVQLLKSILPRSFKYIGTKKFYILAKEMYQVFPLRPFQSKYIYGQQFLEFVESRIRNSQSELFLCDLIKFEIGQLYLVTRGEEIIKKELIPGDIQLKNVRISSGVYNCTLYTRPDLLIDIVDNNHQLSEIELTSHNYLIFVENKQVNSIKLGELAIRFLLSIDPTVTVEENIENFLEISNNNNVIIRLEDIWKIFNYFYTKGILVEGVKDGK